MSTLTGPSINRGRSRQDYCTPRDFLDAVEHRFGKISFDLAASGGNAVVDRFFTEAEDSLKQNWCALIGNLWLNPPFGVIGPWAKKCAESFSRYSRQILMLTPASVGSNWFADYVHEKAVVLFLSPRLQFVGADDPYPKDLMLSVYGPKPGYECWRWK